MRYLLVYLAPSYALSHKGTKAASVRPSCRRRAAELTHKPLIASFARLRIEEADFDREGPRRTHTHLRAASFYFVGNRDGGGAELEHDRFSGTSNEHL